MSWIFWVSSREVLWAESLISHPTVHKLPLIPAAGLIIRILVKQKCTHTQTHTLAWTQTQQRLRDRDGEIVLFFYVLECSWHLFTVGNNGSLKAQIWFPCVRRTLFWLPLIPLAVNSSSIGTTKTVAKPIWGPTADQQRVWLTVVDLI